MLRFPGLDLDIGHHLHPLGLHIRIEQDCRGCPTGSKLKVLHSEDLRKSLGHECRFYPGKD